jgi:hypothetical protein
MAEQQSQGDVFGTDSKLGGVFKGNKFSMQISGKGGSGQELDFEGALVQNLQLNYQRQITRFWALGTQKQYYIEGRTEGQGTLARIVGPQGLIDELVEVLSNLCTLNDRNLTLTANSNVPGECVGWKGANGDYPRVLSISLWGAISTGISFGADAQQFVINSSLALMFTSLRRNKS